MAGSKPAALPLGYTPTAIIASQFELVRTERLELSRREALEPKSSVSTNSTTSAQKGYLDGGYGEIRTCDPSIMSAVL